MAKNILRSHPMPYTGGGEPMEEIHGKAQYRCNMASEKKLAF